VRDRGYPLGHGRCPTGHRRRPKDSFKYLQLLRSRHFDSQMRLQDAFECLQDTRRPSSRQSLTVFKTLAVRLQDSGSLSSRHYPSVFKTVAHCLQDTFRLSSDSLPSACTRNRAKKNSTGGGAPTVYPMDRVVPHGAHVGAHVCNEGGRCGASELYVRTEGVPIREAPRRGQSADDADETPMTQPPLSALYLRHLWIKPFHQ
jgi:hypothetical protein